MDLFSRDDFFYRSLSSLDEDIVLKKILLSHDPDGRHLDSELLLQAMENIMFCCSASSKVSGFDPYLEPLEANAKNNASNIEVIGSQEQLGHIIYRISREMLCTCFVEGDCHTKTMTLFDLLGKYKWDAKLVLVLAAFATNYGNFWFTMQLYPSNRLAALVSILKQLPNDLTPLKPIFKTLTLLVKTMVDTTKCIIEFEGLPLQHVELDKEAMADAKSQIYLATYWVMKSAMTCSSQIADLRALKHEHSNLTTSAAWELSSFFYRLSSICSGLRRQVDLCHQQIDTKIQKKLLNLFEKSHVDNQEVLTMLFALEDDLPLKDGSSKQKLSVSELKNKIVILLVSNPEFFLKETLFFLVQQLCVYPHDKESYEIVWVPISLSDTWAESEKECFEFLSNSLPFYSIRQPWSLCKQVVQYIKQVWLFKDEPLMVVLDSQGVITHSNAFDMATIWGARAYPFSASRENELWEEEKWNVHLMINGIDPLMTNWVEENRNLCIYGGDNLDWIREFNAKMKEIKNSGMQLEIVYVGKKNPSEQVKKILATIDLEKLNGHLLSFSKIQFFWLRLESMRRSKLRLRKKVDDFDDILEEVEALLDFNDEDEKGCWAIFGTGSSIDIVKLQGRKFVECLNNFSIWGENVGSLGFLGALKTGLEPPSDDIVGACSHSNVIPYVDELIYKSIVCDKCKRPMEKFVVYQCSVND